MARLPQREHDPYDESSPTATIAAAKEMLKRLDPKARAQLIAWLALYYQDDGAMFSPQITRRRQRIAIGRRRVLARARTEAGR